MWMVEKQLNCYQKVKENIFNFTPFLRKMYKLLNIKCVLQL